MTMRLSNISFAGTARTLVAVGIDNEAFMFFATAAAAPRRTLVSSEPFLSEDPLAGFGAALGAGLAAVVVLPAGSLLVAGFAFAGAAAGFAAEFAGVVVDEAEAFGAAVAVAGGVLVEDWVDFSVVFTSAPFEPPAAAASGE